MINLRVQGSGFRVQKKIKWYILFFLFCCLYPVPCTLYPVCYAQPISSTELINNAKQYDEKTVAYAGEVIGDIMARGEYAWININDGQNAVGIWIPGHLTKNILYAGSYKSKGDEVEIVGVFHRACPEHGGDLDIHAQAIRQIRIGRPVVEKLNASKRNFALILAGILCLIWILRRSKRK